MILVQHCGLLITSVGAIFKSIIWGFMSAWSNAPQLWICNCYVVCCHPYAMVYPPDTTTLSLASYLLLKTLLPWQHTIYVHVFYCLATRCTQKIFHESHTSHVQTVVCLSTHKTNQPPLLVCKRLEKRQYLYLADRCTWQPCTAMYTCLQGKSIKYI